MVNPDDTPSVHNRGGASDTLPEQDDKAAAVSLLDYIALLLRYKKIIILFPAVAFVISILVSLLLPVRYTGTVHILPPTQSASSLSNLLSRTDGMFGGLLADLKDDKTSSELYVGILKSRTVSDELIARFDLKKLYGLDYIEDVYEKLVGRTTIQIKNKSRIVSVSVEDGDRQRAADMANAYAAALDRIYRTLRISEGQKKRKFLEQRLFAVKVDLQRAEDELKAFQEKYSLVEPKEQAAAAIEVAARIKGEIIATRTELKVLRQFSTEQQNEVIKLKTKIDELQHQLSKMEHGPSLEKNRSSNQVAEESGIFIPIDAIPELSTQLIRLTREAKVQEKVFELVTTQFEMAKMEEARDMPLVQVLDKAVPPEKKSYPKRTSIVLVTTFIVFILAIIVAFVLDFAQQLRSAHPGKYAVVKDQLQHGVPASVLERVTFIQQLFGKMKMSFLQKFNKRNGK